MSARAGKRGQRVSVAQGVDHPSRLGRWWSTAPTSAGGLPWFQVESGSRVGIPAGAARSEARTRAGMERGEAPALDALGTPQASRRGGRRSKRSAAQPAPLTTEGDSLPFPAGRGGGDGRALAHLGGLFRARAVTYLFLPNLATVAYRCRQFLAWAVEPRPGALSGPLWGPRYGVRPKAEGRSPWGCRAGARSAGGGPLAARRSRRGEAPRGGAVSFGPSRAKLSTGGGLKTG